MFIVFRSNNTGIYPFPLIYPGHTFLPLFLSFLFFLVFFFFSFEAEPYNVA